MIRNTLGGFNVSNLTGIKRRMIDIGKKNNFLPFANVWKCTVFSHLHFKIAKCAIMTQKIFFLKNINMGIKKRRILCWFQIRWCRLLKQRPLKKLEPKNYANFEYFPILTFFTKKMFWVIVTLFANFKRKCKKTVHFQTFCKK